MPSEPCPSFPLFSQLNSLFFPAPLTLAPWSLSCQRVSAPTVCSTWNAFPSCTCKAHSLLHLLRFSSRGYLTSKLSLTVLFTFAVPIPHTACLPCSMLTVGNGGPEILPTPDLSFFSEMGSQKANKNMSNNCKN